PAAPPFPCPPGDYVALPSNLAENALQGETYGGEFSFRWRFNDFFILKGSYSLLKIQLHPTVAGVIPEERDEGASPQHMVSLQPGFNLLDDWHWDLWLRYTDELDSRAIPAYFTLDSRLAWQPIEDVELSLVGQNLLEQSHREYVATQVNIPATRIERAVYGQVRWRF
ncbi:MAG: TonB-dependent receptor domain-containing protein, partial [Gammaproteobacteria bacterium]